MKNLILKFLPLIFIILICIPVILPYFHSGYFPTHDGEWAVVRLADMFRTIRDFQFPPRYSGALNFGYGYPLFNFTYPFPYYLGLLLYFLLHSFIASIKTVFVLSVLLSAIFMYLASYELWKSRLAGVVSVIFYIYLPYRIVDLYVRGSIGESLAFALFPLLLYLTLKLFNSPFSRSTVILLSFILGIFVMTHNIMTVLFLPVLLVFTIIKIIHERRFDVLQAFALCLLLGLGISFFFWFPALFEKNNISLSILPIADRNIYFVNMQRLFSFNWGYAPPTETGGLSYQIGIPQIIVVLLVLIISVFSFIKSKMQLTPAKFNSLIFVVLFFLYFVMMFSFTAIIWKTVPLLSEINYPWTLLSQLGFISALLSGFLITQGKYVKYLALILCTVSFILVMPNVKPQSFIERSDNYYLTNEATTTSSQELMPIWVKTSPMEHYKDKVEVINGSATVSNIKFNSKFLKFNYRAEGDVKFQINTIYYPGWKAYLNGEGTAINYQNSSGVMQIDASKYRDTVTMYFGETFPRVISDIVSVTALLVLLFIMLRPVLLFKQ